MSIYNVLKYIFQWMCIIATFVLIAMWLNRYLEDEDMSVIETKTYFETEDDMFPILSICFEQTFDDNIFKE